MQFILFSGVTLSSERKKFGKGGFAECSNAQFHIFCIDLLHAHTTETTFVSTELILRCLSYSSLLMSSDNGMGELIPCLRIRSNSQSRFTILFSHANAEDLGHMYPPKIVLLIGRYEFLKSLGSSLDVDVVCYDYPGYGLYP